MKRYVSTAAFAAAILLSGVSFDALLAPAMAQDEAISFDTFHDQLTPYGAWVYSDRWGEVWVPNNVPDDFRPYDTNGYWANTDEYGWTWVSNYEWGDIPFHYGRWVNDPDDGWLWIPGYVWSPGWVAWRSNGQYTGWMPLPPDRQFLGYSQPTGPSIGISFGGGIGISIDLNNTGDYYGYSQWYGPSYNQDRFASNWVFVGTGHMADRDFHRYAAPRGNYVSIISNTRNITNYTIVNNYIVNKSVDVRIVERAGGRPVPAVHVADVIRKPQFIMRADQGQTVQMRMRDERPRGTGVVGSAPKPSAQIVQSLSTNAPPRAGHPGGHLYTRDTVTKAPLAEKPPGPTNAEAPGHAMAPEKTGTMPSPTTGGGMAGERDRHTPPTTTGPKPTEPGTTPTPENGGAMGERDRHAHTPPTTTPATTGPNAPDTMHRHNPETGGPATTPPVTTPETMHRHENEANPATTPPATGAPRMMGHHENPPANAAPPVVHTQPIVHTQPVVHTPPPPPKVAPKTPPATPEPDKKREHDDTKPQ
jgi:hypothetical protein